MAGIKIPRQSWLTIAPLLDSSGIVFWDTPDFPEIVPQDGDTYVDVDSGYAGRLDLVAFDKYGDCDLWWVIALANGIDLIPTDVVIGMRLRIPEKRYVDTIISKGAL